ncbi:Carboxylesterase family [Popillia japonica]|uniref:Carboxylic ester hydrolase n=1 Tax=Popillia japonica TaxID=7064 RepID=A0AAW1MGU3_POPJA
MLVTLAQEKPLIEISNGLLEGTLRKSYNGRIFSSFEGVPYAGPPVGEFRFEPPREPYNWTGTWIANMKYQCLQSSSTPWSKPVVIGDEDCLYINVYVPREKPNPSDNFNVIAHFHGGAFMLGSGHMYAGPEYLMDEDVILVTMNYRVGALGFLSTEDDVVPGNNGMKDQVMSLKWIQNNIRYFGGNSNSVTITGMSAGGASVHLHYFSPLSKGLFHRGFSESGTALDPWVMQEQGLEKAKHLAMLVGCPTDTSKEIIKCLRSRSGNKIAEQMKEFTAVMGCPLAPFAPLIEGNQERAFLTEHPHKKLTDKTVIDVPWIVAIAEQEGYPLGLSFTKIFGEDLEKFDEAAPYLLDYNLYLKDGINVETLGKLFSDRLFVAGADTAAKLQANANKSPVYFYILGYKGQHSLIEQVGINSAKIGATHGDGTLYYLRTPISETNLSDDDEKMKAIFLQWLLSFADNKEPSVTKGKWKPVVNNNGLNYLYINSHNDVRMETVEDLGFNSFWKQLPFKENQNLLQANTNPKEEL